MKKTAFTFMALATALAATSCQSDEELAQQSTNKPMVINAVAEGIGTKSRAEMAYKYDILWSENDKIHVADNSSNSATFTLQSGAGTTEGTFVQDGDGAGLSGEVQAYYPASLVQENGNLVWPAEQTSATVVPMYSTKTLGGTGTETFAFASLGAMLQIVFTTPQAGVTLKSITVQDADATLSGTFTVDGEGKANITATDRAGITLDLGEGVVVSNKIQYFNIAVPAGTYNNLSITFTATDRAVCTLKNSKSITINHNTVGRLPLTGKEFKEWHDYVVMSARYDGTNYTDLKWATCNLGASSPSDYGDYYAWGETEPYYSSQDPLTWKDGKSGYNWPSYCGSNQFVEWNPTPYDENGILKPERDAARQNWGGNWRMPTQAEFDALVKDCTWTWITEGGHNGYNVTDNKGNSIFLPAAGCRYGSSLSYVGEIGLCWSSSLNTSYSGSAYNLNFSSGSHYVYGSNRYFGQSVRSVTE